MKQVATQLDSIYQSLSLVRDERPLQTAKVEQHCVVIIGIANELEACFDRLQSGQQHGSVRRFFSAMKNGDKDDAELSEILLRLDRAQNELVLRISVAQVGLTGNLNQGFKVSYDLLMDTNRKCQKILGTGLQLASQLQSRQPERSKRWYLYTFIYFESLTISRRWPIGTWTHRTSGIGPGQTSGAS